MRRLASRIGNKDDYRDENAHELWQDPLGMFTTMLLGIDPERGFCISVDPIVHSPTKFFIRMEFKDEHAEEIASRARDRRVSKGAAHARVDVEGRAFLQAEFEKMGLPFVPSHANFVWCRQPGAGVRHYYEILKEQRVLVRYMSYADYGEGLRISVGSDTDIDIALGGIRLAKQQGTVS